MAVDRWCNIIGHEEAVELCQSCGEVMCPRCSHICKGCGRRVCIECGRKHVRYSELCVPIGMKPVHCCKCNKVIGISERPFKLVFDLTDESEIYVFCDDCKGMAIRKIKRMFSRGLYVVRMPPYGKPRRLKRSVKQEN